MKSNTTIKKSNLPEILVIGSGMYVMGKDDHDFGTILPTLLFEQKKGLIGKIHIAASGLPSAKKAEAQFQKIEKKLKTKADIAFYPLDKNTQKSYLEVVKNNSPLMAIVSIPDHLHFAVTDELLDLKIPTLVVKPFTTKFSEALLLCQKAKRKKIWGGVEFHKRFDEANLLLKSNLEEGRIGDPLYFVVEYSQKKKIPLEVFKSWSDKTNIFQYLGVHYADLIYFLTEALPLRVMATGQKNLLHKNGLNNYDSIQANIEWKGKDGKIFHSMIITNWIDSNKTSSMSDQKIKVIGTKGRIESEQKDRGLQIVDDNGIEDVNPYFSKFFNDGSSLYIDGYGPKSIRKFIQDAKDSTKRKSVKTNSATFADGLVSTAILEAVTKSLNKNSGWITIDSSVIAKTLKGSKS